MWGGVVLSFVLLYCEYLIVIVSQCLCYCHVLRFDGDLWFGPVGLSGFILCVLEKTQATLLGTPVQLCNQPRQQLGARRRGQCRGAEVQTKHGTKGNLSDL